MGHPRDIIVADDEKDLATLVTAALEAEEGWSVRSAGNGRQALDLAIEKQPDLMVLDGLMPKLSGFDVSKRIKEEIYPEGGTKILLITAIYKKLQQKYEAIELYKVDRVIYKPFDLDDLVRTVREMLEPGEASAQPDRSAAPPAASADPGTASGGKSSGGGSSSRTSQPPEKPSLWKRLLGKKK